MHIYDKEYIINLGIEDTIAISQTLEHLSLQKKG